jgi:DNA-binding MarR family transcriptional regulator
MQASTSPLETETGSSTELAEQMLHLWRAVMARGQSATYAIFEELDLSLTQVKAMCALCDEELTVKQLAENLGLSLPGASRAVDHLVDRELLHRREDETDRRMKRLRITDAGRIALDRLDEARLAGIANFTATLAPAHRKRLSGALRPILDGLPKKEIS